MESIISFKIITHLYKTFHTRNSFSNMFNTFNHIANIGKVYITIKNSYDLIYIHSFCYTKFITCIKIIFIINHLGSITFSKTTKITSDTHTNMSHKVFILPIFIIKLINRIISFISIIIIICIRRI